MDIKIKKNKIVLILLSIVVLLILAICLRLTFFFTIPKLFDKNSSGGDGYIHPLSVVNIDDDSKYIIAYYLDDYWYIIDDTELIKKYKNTWVAYVSHHSWKSGSNRALHIFKDNERCFYNSLDAFTLIYDDFFMFSKIKMSMDEFEEYYKQNELSGIYNFDDHEIIIIE